MHIASTNFSPLFFISINNYPTSYPLEEQLSIRCTWHNFQNTQHFLTQCLQTIPVNLSFAHQWPSPCPVACTHPFSQVVDRLEGVQDPSNNKACPLLHRPMPVASKALTTMLSVRLHLSNIEFATPVDSSSSPPSPRN